MPASISLCPPPRQRFAGDGPVIEGEHLRTDNLVGLVALPGEHNYVTRAGPFEGAADRGLPVRNRNMPVESGLGDARDDFGDDGFGSLTPWVVRRHPDPVGEARGDAAHQRPLAAVAITAAAEHRGEPA